MADSSQGSGSRRAQSSTEYWDTYRVQLSISVPDELPMCTPYGGTPLAQTNGSRIPVFAKPTNRWRRPLHRANSTGALDGVDGVMGTQA